MFIDGTPAARAASHAAAAGFAKWTPVGHPEVIKMHYDVRIAKWGQAWDAAEPLVNTYSFLQGVSIAGITWGYYNPHNNADDSINIEVTIHDLAGATLEKFLKLKSLQYLIYFKGPDSFGVLWDKPHSEYQPLPDKCDLTFAATQGFTYTITGSPLGKLAKSPTMSLSMPIVIKGLNADNQKHGNIFKDYLKEFAYHWNQNLPEEKQGKAEIHEIKIEEGKDTGAELANRKPVMVVNDKGLVGFDGDGQSGLYIQEYEIKTGTTVHDAITGLWNNRFAGVPTDAPQDIHQAASIEVNYMKYEAGSYLHVRLHKSKETDVTPNLQPVCIGPDLHCAGAYFRADLVKLDFGSIMRYLVGSQYITGVAQPTEHGQNNQDPKQAAFEKEYKNKCGDGLQVKETTGQIPYSPETQPRTNPKFDGWGIMNDILNQHNHHELKIDIEMPYAYGFSPEYVGGLLKNGVDGCAMGSILFTEGVQLKFYWYTDPLCQTLALVPKISTCYRISRVSHSIGLNGNTTQIALTHMTIGN